jgi:hypothetical protein
VRKRITVIRAAEGVDRDEFVRRLEASTAEAYVTDPDPRPATAVICGAVDVDADVLASYDVDEHVMWDEPIEGPDKAMFAFLRARPDLEQDDFVKRYREHADVARVEHPGIRRYMQNIVVDQSGQERWLASAISEIHFAGPAEYRDRFWKDEDSPAVIERDIGRFVERDAGRSLVVTKITR